VLRGLCALLLAAPVALGACGEEEGPSRSDLRTVRSVLTSSSAVQSALTPLYSCPFEDTDCYRAAGSQIVETVEKEQAAFQGDLEDTDDECLAEVGRLYDDSLDAYLEAGRAASDGDTASADRAISRSSTIEIAYLRKLDECGFSEGKAAEVGAEMRRVNVRVLQLVEEMTACTTRRCAIDVAKDLELVAQQGAKASGSFIAELPSEAPACLEDALSLMVRSFESLERMSRAVVSRDFRTAEKEGTQSDELGLQAQERMAGCLTTALETG
jgi:hypothetical protein